MDNVYFSPPFVVEISQRTHTTIVEYIKNMCAIPQSENFCYSKLTLIRKRFNGECTYHLVAGELVAAEKKQHESKNPKSSRKAK